MRYNAFTKGKNRRYLRLATGEEKMLNLDDTHSDASRVESWARKFTGSGCFFIFVKAYK